MRIVFIGSGNVATHLSYALKTAGNDIIQIFSNTFENAQHLASQVDAEPVNNINSINDNADIYIFSIKDDALSDVVKQMPVTRGIWTHTSGSLPMSILSANKSDGCGVIYPLQTFSKNRKADFKSIPVFIEADSTETLNVLDSIARSISGDVRNIDSENRRYMHLAAVFANNFSNHMFTLASEILSQKDIPFEILKPLIRETADKVMDMDPAKAQTGPAVRYDEKIIQKHIDLITDPDTKEIYKFISKSINKKSK